VAELGPSRRPTRLARGVVGAGRARLSGPCHRSFRQPDILRRMAQGEIEISHIAFDQLPTDRGMKYARELLGFFPAAVLT
jgi:hypothetical protein